METGKWSWRRGAEAGRRDGGWLGGAGWVVVPGVRDDDVVEGVIALAEAGEADLDDHARGDGAGVVDGDMGRVGEGGLV